MGIGGIFFRAKDPSALAEWYAKNLGINPAPSDMETPPWISSEGATVFAPFAADTDYFEADRQFMLNCRGGDRDGRTTRFGKSSARFSGQARIADTE